MKICFIIEYYYPHIGGAEVMFQHLAEGLVRAGHTCEVITCRLPGTSAFEVLNGVPVRRVRVPRVGDRYWFTIISTVAAWASARKADVIHTMVYNGAFPAKVLSFLLKKPVVIHVFEVIRQNWFRIGINPLSALLFRLIEKAVLSVTYDAYSCISRNTLSLLMEWGIPSQKLFLAYPGIDYSLFDPAKYGNARQQTMNKLGIGEGRFLYSFYGRPGFVKGVEHLVRAVPLVREKIPGSVLMLILSRKPASGHARIRKTIDMLGLTIGKDILVIDPVPRAELPAYILACDCVVIPSVSEGFGFTCVEACAMGRPVVATTAGSLPEVVYGRHVLVKPADPNALAQGIVDIHKGKYRSTAEKRFTWEDNVERHVKAYERLLEGMPAGGDEKTIPNP
jgi:D-inositol-3-phosphate glycosyltransferase